MTLVASLPLCGRCANWELTGALGKCGYGTCAVRPNHAMRAGLTTSAQCVCRIGRFVPIVPAKPA